MLKELKITNLALIEELQVSFEAGLMVFTGETGAGKSIVLQAIGLISGARAASTWVRNGEEQATVEALFECGPDSHLLPELRQMGFESEGEVLIKRVLATKGSNRFYINGSLATARVAAEVSAYLLTVAGQHDQQQLLQPRSHLDFVDMVGDLMEEREEFANFHGQYQRVKKEYETLRQQEMDKEQRRDFLAYQTNEIRVARPILGEDEELAAEKARLKASGELQRLGDKSYKILAGAVGDGMAQLRKHLEQMAALDKSLAPLAEEVNGYGYQLEESVVQLRDYLACLPNDDADLDRVMARIDLLQQLKRKYGNSLAAVIDYGERAEAELRALDDLDQRLATLESELGQLARELGQRAGRLSAARRKVALEFSQKLQEELRSLCFEQAVFEVCFEGPAEPELSAVGRHGWDNLEFKFSANLGEPPQPLAKIASGGELSRLMLALKCLLARKDLVETVIFDEVDAGISGKAAEAVARKIQELASHHQVMCITHLPQIACRAQQHFLVEKMVRDLRTHTTISLLDAETRIAALARMLDGESVSAKTMDYAKELLTRKDGVS